ncbi:MAG: peptidylprolyl isomerase [Hyphomicrobiaceae bacterium]
MTTLYRGDQTGNPAANLSGCSAKPANLPRPQPIVVNGVTVPRAAIARETQNHPAAKPIEAWHAAARALVVRELLLQEARRLAIVPAPITDAEGRRETDEEAMIRQLVEQEVVTPEPDEAACRRVYATQRLRFRSSDIFEVRHILVAAAPHDREARMAARAVAEAAIVTLAAEPERFGDLATLHSACPSRTVGGALGQVSSGQTVPQFEAALATAPVGTVAPEPVETRYGFHVVFVDRRIEGQELTYEMVAGQIARWLVARSRHAALRQYIGLLAGRATITGIDLKGATSPLVQ